MSAPALDGIALEILWTRLISLVDEAATTLVRTSFSTIVRESNDFCVVLVDTQGRSIAQNTGTVGLFTATIPAAMRALLKRFPLSDWRPGDVAITNDPWLASGHKPDIAMAVPVFHRGRPVAFAASIAHAPDIGGRQSAADSKDFFEEGLLIPPLKLINAGVPDPVLHDIIRRNVRVPEQVVGDLYAAVAGGRTCSERLVALLEEYALSDLSPVAEAIQARSEAAMRRVIREAPDGTWRNRIDSDDHDGGLHFELALTIRGDEILVDYTGTSPQVNRAVNSVYNCTYAYTCYSLKCALDPHTPNNDGSFRPVRVEAPEGCVLNPRYPAPVAGRSLTFHYLPALIYGALVQAMPERVIAECGAPSNRTTFAGIGRDGRPYSLLMFTAGGLGARPTKDGESAIAFPANTGCPSIEVIESIAPLMFHQKELRTDSGGPGRFRGGLGQQIRIEALSPQPTMVSLRTERLQNPPRGVFGGGHGATAEVYVGDRGFLHPRAQNTIKQGDVVTICCPGGGGSGPARERPEAEVARDVREGRVSPGAARAVYGCRAELQESPQRPGAHAGGETGSAR